MKLSISTVFVILSFSFQSLAQCTISGLNATYCENDPPVIVSVDSTNGILVGQGVTDSTFTPSSAGSGTHIINYIDTTTGTYTVLKNNGSYNPLQDTGTSVILADDAVSNQFPVGFSFRFFGIPYTQFRISSNGFITFENTLNDGCCTGQSLPNATAPNNLIAFDWEDLYPPGNGTIKYYTTGTSPNRKLVISFTNIPYSISNNAEVTSQVVLSETTNAIEIHSDFILAEGGQTMGIENQTGTTAYTVTGRNSQTWSANDDYVAFYPGTIICSDTVEIIAAPTLAIAISADTVCPNIPVTLTAVSNGDTYNWAPATGLSSTTSASTIANIPITETYTITVTETSTGCTSIDSVTVAIHLPPQPDLGGDTLICNDSYIILDPGFGFVSYDWNDNSSNQYLIVDGETKGVGTHTYSVTVTDNNGCTAVDTIIVTINDCVGVEEQSASNFFSVFPNPNNGEFTIQFQNSLEKQVKIINQEGRLVSSFTTTKNQQNIDIKAQPKGMYMLLVEENGKIKNMKIVLQ